MTVVHYHSYSCSNCCTFRGQDCPYFQCHLFLFLLVGLLHNHTRLGDFRWPSVWFSKCDDLHSIKNCPPSCSAALSCPSWPSNTCIFLQLNVVGQLVGFVGSGMYAYFKLFGKWSYINLSLEKLCFVIVVFIWTYVDYNKLLVFRSRMHVVMITFSGGYSIALCCYLLESNMLLYHYACACCMFWNKLHYFELNYYLYFEKRKQYYISNSSSNAQHHGVQ